MSAYRFITRTVLHNFFYGIAWFFCNFWKLIAKAFTSFTLAPIIWVSLFFTIFMIVDICLLGGMLSNLHSLYWCLGIAVIPTIMHWVAIDTNVMDKDRYEPKWAIVAFVAVTQFLVDIFHPDDEVEKREKAAKKEKSDAIKAEANAIREAKKEAKKVEENKFDRFEVMEVIE